MTYHLAEKKIDQSYHHRIATLLADWIQAEKSSGVRILEVGVGRGNIPILLRKKLAVPVQYLGADIDHDSLKALVEQEILDEAIPFTSGDLSDVAHSGEKFDILVMSHVLEHIENPRQFLKQCQDIFLTPHGITIAAVPNTARPDCLVNSLLGRHYSNAGHYYSWDKSHWRRFIEDRCGYETVEYHADGWALPVPRRIRNIPYVGPAVLRTELFLGRILPGWSFSNLVIIR